MLPTCFVGGVQMAATYIVVPIAVIPFVINVLREILIL